MRAAHARTRAMIKMRSFSAITPCMPQCVHTYITLTRSGSSFVQRTARARPPGGSLGAAEGGIYICKQASIPYLGNVHIQYCTHTHKQDTHRHLPTHTTLSSSRKLRDRLRVALIGAAQPITRARLCTTLQNGAAEGLLAGEWWECC